MTASYLKGARLTPQSNLLSGKEKATQMKNGEIFYDFTSGYQGEWEFELHRLGSRDIERVSLLVVVPSYTNSAGVPQHKCDFDQYKREIAAKHGLAILRGSQRILSREELSKLCDYINKYYKNDGGFEAYYKLTLRRGYYNRATQSFARIIDNPDGAEIHEYFDVSTDSWTPFDADKTT
jgi:hypothetical protein